MPFSTDQFFEVFAAYNESVWPLQIVWHVLAIASVILLLRSGKNASRMTNLMLALLWLWMGSVYHLTFFRRINPVAILFGVAFVMQGLLVAWIGVIRHGIKFDRNPGGANVPGAVLVVSALALYPLAGYLVGQRYPAFPTFGLPCPTTIFSIGLFTFAIGLLPKSVLVVPVLWTFIGSYPAFRLGVLEDLMLLPAGAVGVWMILRKRRKTETVMS